MENNKYYRNRWATTRLAVQDGWYTCRGWQNSWKILWFHTECECHSTSSASTALIIFSEQVVRTNVVVYQHHVYISLLNVCYVFYVIICVPLLNLLLKFEYIDWWVQ